VLLGNHVIHVAKTERGSSLTHDIGLKGTMVWKDFRLYFVSQMRGQTRYRVNLDLELMKKEDEDGFGININTACH
jgi:hypothetical protein